MTDKKLLDEQRPEFYDHGNIPYAVEYTDHSHGNAREPFSALSIPAKAIAAIAAQLGTMPEIPRPGTPEFAILYPTIHGFLSTITGSDPEYIVYFGTKWLIGIISAIHGQHSPLILVLCGGQNVGKTEWFRRMMPASLKKYYAESKLDAGKDDEILMTQKLVIMDDEMSGKSKRENGKLKSITSKQTFSLREPYGRNNVDLNRLAVLCGTTNDTGIIFDATGNRRFIPVMVEKINYIAYNLISKDELFSEMNRLYRAGFKWELSSEDIDHLNRDTEKFEVVTSESELILKYFKAGEEEFTATDIKVIIERNSQQRLSLDAIGKQLKKLKFEQVTRKVSGHTKRVYMVSEIGPTITSGSPYEKRPSGLPF